MTPSPPRFDHRMTDYEALMWHLDEDPWLSSNIVGITLLDRALDFADFRMRMANAVARIPRLRQRVHPSLGGIAPPRWATDPEFDLDYHLRKMALPSPGSLRQLLDIATDLMQDPFDRARPLWQYIVFDGFEGGRGAMFSKLHHTVGDATRAIEIAAQYLTPDPVPPPAEAIDLAPLIRAETTERGGWLDQVFEVGGVFARRGIDAAQGLAAEVSETLSRPDRTRERLEGLVDDFRLTSAQLAATRSPGSPLWSKRSRLRRIELFEVPFDTAKDASKRLGGKLNDFFVTGAVEGAARYHEMHGSPVDAFTVSFTVDTRSETTDESVSNQFAVVPIELPARGMALTERFRVIHERLATMKGEVHGSGLLEPLSGVLNLLPSSVLRAQARDLAANIDFATSNAAGAPFPLYMSGARVVGLYPVGPAAGTALNQTMLSYDGRLFIGMNIDTRAIEDPAGLQQHMRSAYDALIEAAGGG